VTLTLHSGVAAGELTEINFGGHKDRWEYVVAGEPIRDTGRALDCAKKGEAVVHERMWASIRSYAIGEAIPGAPHYKLKSVPRGIVPTPDVLSELIHFAGLYRRYESPFFHFCPWS
jgi:hypothetical protein